MIYLTGDTHGDIDWSKINTKNWPEQKQLTKNDYLIIVGDVAMRWFDTLPNGELNRTDKYTIDYYNKKKCTTLFIDGNHENHNALDSYPVTEWHGGKVHQLADSVYHLMRGQVFDIDGLKFFTMGGARSTDIYSRKENISWWAREIPSREELQEGIDNLEKVDFKVDYVLTHCCGTSLMSQLVYSYDSDTLTSFFDHLEFDFGLQFKHWYFGHYHRDKKLDDKHTCLYDSIVKLGE